MTYASTLPEVDADRIGIFGSSYSGGQVLVVAALDRRVKALVSQVPLVSRHDNFHALVVHGDAGRTIAITILGVQADFRVSVRGRSPVPRDPAGSVAGDAFNAVGVSCVQGGSVPTWASLTTSARVGSEHRGEQSVAEHGPPFRRAAGWPGQLLSDPRSPG
jgi:hypothetical protein